MLKVFCATLNTAQHSVKVSIISPESQAPGRLWGERLTVRQGDIPIELNYVIFILELQYLFK